MTRIFGYGRASTDSQQITLKNQQEVCEAYFRLREVSGDDVEWCGWHPDPAITTKVHFPDRPMGQKLLETVEEGDCIVVSNFDRIFRSVIDCDNCLKMFSERKIGIVILDVDVNTETPLGRAFMKIIAVLKELEREEISRRTREAHRYSVKHGHPVNGFAPIGFKKVGFKSDAAYLADEMERRWCYEVVRLHDQERMTFWGIAKKMGSINPNKDYSWSHHLRMVRKGYVSVKCGFPCVGEKDIPCVTAFKEYLVSNDGQPPQLEAFAVSEGRLHTLPPMQGHRPISVELADLSPK